MSTTFKPVYSGYSNVIIQLSGLANNAARQSNVIFNSGVLALDYLIGGGFRTVSGTLGTGPVVNVWAFDLVDGTNWAGTYTSGGNFNPLGSGDAAFNMPANTGNLRLVTQVPINNATSGLEFFGQASVAAAYNGVCPVGFGLVVQNSTGLAFDQTSGQLWYQPVGAQGV